MKTRSLAFFTMILMLLSGCQSAYYAAWEKVGVEKREIMVDRVEDARESQEDAQEQFSSALEEFSALINFQGGELEEVYERLSDEYNDSKAAADEVSNRINKVASVADALFDEWEDELERYQNENYRRTSEQQLRDTRRKYESMLSAMRKAEGTMTPVLRKLEDNVLFLKHNLNASAIGSLEGELTVMQADIRVLIRNMRSAIAESDAFIASMK
ncbi:DUF2959 domain-containing protein [Alteromonas ponticola]|nr:DUF2959 domain-containing protein [Alteromonas ponticola]